MKKTTLNLIVDAALMLCLCAITGIGFLIKYTLPSGQHKWENLGSNPELLWLNMDRHQWGMIHFIISLCFLALLIWHLQLHWRFITTIFKRLIKDNKIKVFTTTLFLSVAVLLTCFPFIITPTQIADTTNQHLSSTTQHHQSGHSNNESTLDKKHSHNSTINGRMTLKSIVTDNKIPASYLIKELGLSDKIDLQTRLGQIRKQYGVSMSEIEQLINNYHN